MAVSIEKTGDWEKVTRFIGAIKKEMSRAQELSLKRFGLKAEGLAKSHISDQDLGWAPLKAATISEKVRGGYSEDILIRTSTYFQSITSWVDNGETMNGLVGLGGGKGTRTTYAGVKKTAKDENGVQLANIAVVHEYGSVSAHIPARPLWQPVFYETLNWHANTNMPERIFIRNMQKYL